MKTGSQPESFAHNNALCQRIPRQSFGLVSRPSSISIAWAELALQPWPVALVEEALPCRPRANTPWPMAASRKTWNAFMNCHVDSGSGSIPAHGTDTFSRTARGTGGARAEGCVCVWWWWWWWGGYTHQLLVSLLVAVFRGDPGADFRNRAAAAIAPRRGVGSVPRHHLIAEIGEGVADRAQLPVLPPRQRDGRSDRTARGPAQKQRTQQCRAVSVRTRTEMTRGSVGCRMTFPMR